MSCFFRYHAYIDIQIFHPSNVSLSTSKLYIKHMSYAFNPNSRMSRVSTYRFFEEQRPRLCFVFWKICSSKLWMESPKQDRFNHSFRTETSDWKLTTHLKKINDLTSSPAHQWSQLTEDPNRPGCLRCRMTSCRRLTWEGPCEMMLLKLITSALRDLETWGRSVLFGVWSLDLCYKRKGGIRAEQR